MIPDTKNRYLITFDYSFLNQIDNIISKNQIIQQTFEKNISYLIELEKENENKVLSSLVLVTLKQIKIKKINLPNNDDYEVGTDKPLGSKAAIDEN